MIIKKLSDMAIVRDFQPLSEAMDDIALTSFREFYFRYIIVVCGIVLAVLITGDPLAGVGLAAYCIISFIYTYAHYLRRIHGYKVDDWLLMALFMVTTGIYSASVMHIFTYNTISLMMIGLFAGIMQAIYNITRHHRFNMLLVWDMFLIILQTAFFVVHYSKVIETPLEKAILLFLALGVAFYFTHAQYRSVQTRDVLRKSHEEALQTQKMRVIGQLTAGVAHDFNNLLTVVRGNIELAEISFSREDYQQYLSDAKKGADQAAALVAQLLAFSRKAQMRQEKVDIHLFFKEHVRIVKRVLPKSIEVEVSVKEPLEFLYCDYNLLQSTLLNLIINARDAMKGNGHILIEGGQADEAMLQDVKLAVRGQKPFGYLRVSDTGPGIPKNDIPNVIEPFFTTKLVGEGSGLGLSSAKGFAEQLGGDIHIGNRPQGGAMITLFLPMSA